MAIIRLMARSTVTQITDDLDGSKNASEVSFAYDGTQYTIDLSRKNRAVLEKALKPFTEAATKVSRRGSQRRSASNGSGRRDLPAIRAWAADQGIDVASRGRIPRSVVDGYDAAH